MIFDTDQSLLTFLFLAHAHKQKFGPCFFQFFSFSSFKFANLFIFLRIYLFYLSFSLSFFPLPFLFIGIFLFSVRMELCMTNFIGKEGLGRRWKKRNWQPEGGFWVNFCWVCAAGLSEPLTPLQSILWPIIDPILVTFGQICKFCDPNLVTFYFYELTIFQVEWRTLNFSAAVQTFWYVC